MTARVALLGVGTVGSALLQRFGDVGKGMRVVLVSSSSQTLVDVDADGIDTATAVEKLRASELTSHLGQVGPALGGPDGCRVVVDATASPRVAARHARWLVRGIHVVTASKIANGGRQTDADALTTGARAGASSYGASATVGAGLPLLRTLHELRAGGDEIHKISGVLSGSIAWLLDAYAVRSGTTAFSELVVEAHAQGLTEPDPQIDLSGVDVQRKLVIMARAAGIRLEPESVDVAPLEPTDGLSLDDLVADRQREAAAAGRRLRHVATWSRDDGARVGLAALAPDDPLAGGVGTDNRVAIWSTRYRDQPIVIQGPGAGAEVTAAALLDDIRRAVQA